MRIHGVGEAKAMSIVAALELGQRRRDTTVAERPLITGSRTAFEILHPVVSDLAHEEFWLLLLDRGNRLLDRCRVSQGGMHGTVADPKLIFREALDRRASSVILCHNHPSGQLRPSAEDISLTRKLVEGGRFLDILVQDHLIVTAGGYYSFADNGQLN
jgi:DNA repair protein RadC